MQTEPSTNQDQTVVTTPTRIVPNRHLRRQIRGALRRAQRQAFRKRMRAGTKA